MPRVKSLLSPAEYAVLGLLRRQPAHGYELQRQLGGRHGLGLVCPVEPAMVYAMLKGLAGLDLIRGEMDSTTYPPKTIYHVTDAGDAEFLRWLGRPVSRMREVRLDLMAKLYFLLEQGSDAGREEARRLIEGQVGVCDAYAGEIEQELQAVPSGGFDALALSAKLSAARLTSTWLSECLESLDARQKVES